ncbi:MAG: sigma-70 family RNA polymerase sigma factor [Chlorobi bacterium]|nr:sigma-70 family RNA polymerase sigma factor [Chlorobiota bacterium]
MGTRSSASLADIDRQLVERVLAKDPTVIEDIVRTYKREVYHLALQLCRDHDDAEDLVQEVFIRAWKSLDSFRGDARLSTWLHRITVNLYINSTRSKSHQHRKEQESFDEEYMTGGRGAEFDPERLYSSQEIGEHIERALRKLSPAQRVAFVLRHYHDLPIKEIAEHMHNTEGTVKVLLFRAVRNLQKHLSFYRDDTDEHDT